MKCAFFHYCVGPCRKFGYFCRQNQTNYGLIKARLMDTLFPFALLCFTSFFTLTNPLGTMPVFLTMTQGMDNEERRHIVKRATIISFLILIVFTFSGQFLFKFFGISTNGFRIAA